LTADLALEFTLTDHCCRHCMGRILVRNRIYMCSVCECEALGKVEAICACGMRSASQRDLPRDLRQAYRCGINPNRTIANSARIIVFYGGEPAQPLGSA
jgi:hypothetical protein